MPEITYGNREGQWFTERRFEKLARVAEEIEAVLPGATGWHIWYDAVNDFHCLQFEHGGRKYVVQLYKVYTLHVEGHNNYFGDYPKRNFGHDQWGVADFFQAGKHINWPAH